MGAFTMEKRISQLAYETFEHGADIGIRGFGSTLEEAFVNAAKAMFSLIIVNFHDLKPIKSINIQCEAIDYESLLVAFLNELLAQTDINQLMFCEFQIKQNALLIKGTARGEPFDPSRHEPGVEVKGATFTMAKVEQKNNMWIAQCVVDV